ncbi:mevalonate kinase, putative [Trypanosoma brucei gambiense DAL972]|uniref:Mevalonate kinase n=1 Tax=Trypanosoma brucei gambiense (strain MHOM/CI/86/DAL972) TaxID=679716 RepID=C9ZN67_TRYB9|nr:mevalonate kinase, putative [Trypanosoma brucei gambiense DAL972]CBH10721.1 mevalonate kinase, putative [Trypanosoma brucei gambiense DAL972]|eukprot:XP_011773009.1 mevalonate kinase, putative [Trypanosoma brucei gambiense DAL972]
MHVAVKDKTTRHHIGYGKVILFGEHFVVYGAESIVAGINEYTTCEISRLKHKPNVVEVIDERPAVPGYIKEKREEQRVAHGLVLRHLNIDTSKDGLLVKLGGPLVPSSGIGASASDVVSLSRALNELYTLNLSEEAVNRSAYAGECGYHGTPSGVDNTAATYGGIILFRRALKKSVFSRLALGKPLSIIVCSTGITASTTKVVADVARLKAAQPSWFDDLFEQYNACVREAKKALQSGNLRRVGELMNINHTLCQKLTVSCPELDAIATCCRTFGALGAKMSGTGRGGLVVALAANTQERDRIAKAVREQCKEAKFVWRYSVQPGGSKL